MLLKSLIKLLRILINYNLLIKPKLIILINLLKDHKYNYKQLIKTLLHY